MPEVVVRAAVTIEPARPWHARRLTAIAFAAKRHWGYPEAWIRMWWDEMVVPPEYLSSSLAIIARRDGRVVGWAAVRFERGRWALEHLWVDPAHLRSGVGSALLGEVADAAARRGARRLVIESDPNAAPFYERYGAARVGEVASSPAPRRIPVLELALGEVVTAGD